MKKIILRLLARATLKKYKPVVIAVTGSVGKTTTKEAIFTVLEKSFSTRKSPGNFNTETGVPLSILGSNRSLFAFFKGLWELAVPVNYPKVLVLEYAADRPGDIRYLVKHFPPDIAVVTSIGKIPVHLEFYKNREELVAEKTLLVKNLKAAQNAVLNIDDPDVAEMARQTKAHVISYGIKTAAAVKASGITVKSGPDISEWGLQFKLEVRGKVVPVFVPGMVGEHLLYCLLAAAAVAGELEISVLDIVNNLQNFQRPAGRLNPLPGVKDTIILDDTYNSSPIAASRALAALKEVYGKRKIAVLGDMLELGERTEDAHREIGLEAAQLPIDFLVTVGLRSKFTADEALAYGMSKNAVLSFDSADEARLPVQDLMRPGDTILVKGSRAMKMEKIVREIMAEPGRADELLV